VTLPPSFLALIESHACFSGVFRYDDTVQMVLDPIQPPEASYTIQCQDCLLWHAGILRRHLATGVDGYALAREATAHVSSTRGYDAAIGGYHSNGVGFWLSAVYIASLDAFLLDGHRSRTGPNDIGLLVQSFVQKVWTPADVGMTDPSRYTTQPLLVDMTRAAGNWPDLQAFLASPAVHASATASTRAVTLASYQRPATHCPAVPGSAALAGVPVVAAVLPAAPAAPAVPLREGERCPQCGHAVQWRQLLTSSYLGCLC